MADHSICELQQLLRWDINGDDKLVECPAQVLKQKGVTDEIPCLPHGAVHAWGMAEPYHAGNGRPAKVTDSDVMWSDFHAKHTSHAAAFITDCSLSSWECLARRLMSQCRNRGMSAPRTLPAIAEPAERRNDKCCGSVTVQWNIETWLWRRVSSLMHRSQCRCPGLALTMIAWWSHCQLSVQFVVSVLVVD